MKKFTLSHFILGNVFTILILMFVFGPNLPGQTPQYYNTTTGTGVNTYPWGQPLGQRVHWLIRPGTLNLPTPCPQGNITKLYFYMGNAGSATFTNLTIRLGALPITTLPAAWYTTELDTVYFRASVSLSCSNNTWMVITLDRPFSYDTSKALVIDVQQCGYSGTGLYVRQSSGTPATRNYGTPAPCPVNYAGQDGQIMNFGVDVYVPPPSTPQYYNYNTSVGANSFPFNIATGKMVQWLVSSGEFNQPTPAPSGNITAVYFYMAGAATNRLFNTFTVRMGRTSLTSLPTGTFYSGPLDTVFHRDTVTLSSTAATWMVIPLDVPFLYYNDSSLIIEVGQCSYTGTGTMTVNQTTLTGNRRSWSVGGCPFVYTSQGTTVANCGIYIPVPVGISNYNNEIPDVYKLEQNYPNPFNPVTSISFAIPKAGIVKLVIYDVLGREVASVLNEFITAGNHSIEFDASSLASGVYFYTLRVNDFTDTKKMMLLK
jgi:hypothetical protein